jgi:hypothetical protein
MNAGKQYLLEIYLYEQCTGTREGEQYLHDNNACENDG